jgi:secreted trypsin-like serine protease
MIEAEQEHRDEPREGYTRQRWLWVAIVAAVLLIGLIGSSVASAATRHHERAQILGGTAIPTGALPELAFIQDDLGNESYDCTGTVLSSNVVLTAGHCVYNETTGGLASASGFQVTTGRPDLADMSAGQTSGVSQVIPYPSYNPATRDEDVALLKLSTPTTAPAITLATSNDTSLWQAPTNLAIAGWGLTDGSNPDSQPDQVQWATTVAQSPTYCTQEASLANSPFDAAGQLCAVSAPTDQTGTCNGDSGGPILADYLTGSPIEVGITSWGMGNSGDPCYTSLPDFFTRADSISTWAEGWVQTLVPPSPPSPTSASPTGTRHRHRHRRPHRHADRRRHPH